MATVIFPTERISSSNLNIDLNIDYFIFKLLDL